MSRHLLLTPIVLVPVLLVIGATSGTSESGTHAVHGASACRISFHLSFESKGVFGFGVFDANIIVLFEGVTIGVLFLVAISSLLLLAFEVLATDYDYYDQYEAH